MLGGISPPWAPSFRCAAKRLRAHSTRRSPQPEVSVRERVRPAQRAHGDILRCPLTDAPYIDELLRYDSGIGARRELRDLTGRDRPREQHDRFGTTLWQPYLCDRRRRGLSKALGTHGQACQRRGIEGALRRTLGTRERLAELVSQPAGERGRALH